MIFTGRLQTVLLLASCKKQGRYPMIPLFLRANGGMTFCLKTTHFLKLLLEMKTIELE